MLFNCLAIYTIAPWVLASMGSTTFIGFYLGSACAISFVQACFLTDYCVMHSGGVAANIFSHYWHKFARPNPNYQSHGASGTIQ